MTKAAMLPPCPNDEKSNIDRLWLWISIIVWLLATGWLLFTWWCREPTLNVLFGAIPVCLLWGGILTLYFVGIPLRIALNLIFRDRRRQRLLETVMCVVAFVTLTSLFFLAIRFYPRDW